MSLGESGIYTAERRSVTVELQPYCFFPKEGNFLEVCWWSNGEGYDITFSEGSRQLSLTDGEWAALQVAILYQAPKKG